MTTNTQDEKWSDWIEWTGKAPSVDDSTIIEWVTNDGREDSCELGELCFGPVGGMYSINKYRYQLKDQPEVTEAEEEEWQRMDKEQGRQQYSAYYKDVRHIEYIDVYRTVDLFGCEKHGHPISHAAKKLLLSGARTGGKDVEEDVREAIDSLYRWLEMREEDKRAL